MDGCECRWCGDAGQNSASIFYLINVGQVLRILITFEQQLSDHLNQLAVWITPLEGEKGKSRDRPNTLTVSWKTERQRPYVRLGESADFSTRHGWKFVGKQGSQQLCRNERMAFPITVEARPPK
ncbi:hypothetical protein RCL_jg15440.t1 [Rhizophagus clarus]|uniref:Uncharacterized protein n=1 Tax=Rhizophagus clarus TaxID=94130 RepID=A0A8H3QAM5_9GLOM|nr:hypothetical protein RCL_jg15440.t1 [Rhizophagus clarus]